MPYDAWNIKSKTLSLQRNILSRYNDIGFLKPMRLAKVVVGFQKLGYRITG